MQATYGKMKIPMKIDITTGDEITPKEIQFTAKKRDSLSVLQDTNRILLALEESTVLQDLWKRYQAQNLYAREITYSAIMETVNEFTEKINF